jgi:copper chaperone CopZ
MQKNPNNMQTTITIKGTHCNACKALIEDICQDTAGVKSAKVDFSTGKTDIEHDESLNWHSLKQEIEAAGNYQIVV